MFTTKELQIIAALIDVGIKTAGLQVFQNEGGVHLQSILTKLQQMADEANTEIKNEKEIVNG